MTQTKCKHYKKKNTNTNYSHLLYKGNANYFHLLWYAKANYSHFFYKENADGNVNYSHLLWYSVEHILSCKSNRLLLISLLILILPY